MTLSRKKSVTLFMIIIIKACTKMRTMRQLILCNSHFSIKKGRKVYYRFEQLLNSLCIFFLKKRVTTISSEERSIDAEYCGTVICLSTLYIFP